MCFISLLVIFICSLYALLFLFQKELCMYTYVIMYCSVFITKFYIYVKPLETFVLTAAIADMYIATYNQSHHKHDVLLYVPNSMVVFQISILGKYVYLIYSTRNLHARDHLPTFIFGNCL